MTSTRGKIRILHIIESLGSGGAERLLYTNLKYMDGNRFEHSVVTVFHKADYWKQPILEMGISVESLNCGGYRDVPAAIFSMMRKIRRLQPDVIHTHLFAANILGRVAGKLTRTPVLSSIHNPEYEPEAFIDTAHLHSRKLPIAKFLDKHTAFFSCKEMIAVSNHVKQTTILRLRYPSRRIKVLYNPVDESDLAATLSRKSLLEKLGLPQNSLILLNVGRVSPQKGLIYAIQAMPEVLRHFPNAHLISIGSQDDQFYLSLVQDEIEKLGISYAVHLLGEKRKVRDFLHACDLFVFPTLYEGLGIALAEAMAVGCACIVSEIAPLNEFVIHTVNGIFVEPQKPRELASAIINLLNDSELRKTLAMAAQKTASELFQPQAAANRLGEIYMSVLKS